jgi:uncharacterized protein (TIGR03382 family)
MNSILKITAGIALITSSHAATSKIDFAIGQLRDSDSNIIADGGGVWAVIVSGLSGAPPSSGSLPGGLTDGMSLTTMNAPQILVDFDNFELTAGPRGSYTVEYLGGFTSGNDLGLNGVVVQELIFDVFDSPDAGYSPGTLWGIYWFPGAMLGDTLSGEFQVGGYANSSPNTASSSNNSWGTTVPNAGALVESSYLETTFNQNELGGGDTGITAQQFTAVMVPEPGVATLALLGMGALLRRRRH